MQQQRSLLELVSEARRFCRGDCGANRKVKSFLRSYSQPHLGCFASHAYVVTGQSSVTSRRHLSTESVVGVIGQAVGQDGCEGK